MSDPFLGLYIIGFVLVVSFGSLMLLLLSEFVEKKFGGKTDLKAESDPFGLLLFNSLPAIAFILVVFRFYRRVREYV